MPGPAVPEASGLGLARWSGEMGVVYGDGGRFRLSRAGRSESMSHRQLEV